MGYDKQYNFRKALNLIEKRKLNNEPPYFDYLEKGYYAKHLKRYYGLFKEKQIKIVFYNDLKNDANKVCNDIIKFLGMDTPFDFETSKIYMKSHPIIKYDFLFKISILLQKVSYQLYKYLKGKSMISEYILTSDKEYALNYYRKDILKLEKLINKDLSNWYKKNNI